jgi:hypothetical protein
VAPCISAAVEGDTDAVVVGRLIRFVGAEVGRVYVMAGKSNLRKRVYGFNHAAHHAPWFILVDLDQDEPCASPLCAEWVPHPAPQLCLRVAVHAMEAWLMADAAPLGAFIGVAPTSFPVDPDAEPHPKRALVNAARRSRHPAVVKDMVPREGAGRTVGPAYASRIMEFASYHWRPDVAATRSESLQRAIACLRRLVAT